MKMKSKQFNTTGNGAPAIAIYARKSTESEDRQVLSIDSQIQELKDYAIRENLGVPVVFTESKSAKAPGRPTFDDLLLKINKGLYDKILCWKLDRLARNPVDGGALIWAIEENKLKTIYTPQNTFRNSGNDKFWMQLEFGMAKKYVDDLSDNTKRGHRTKLRQGWRPGPVPLGYLNDKVSKTIVRDPERFEVVRAIWEMMLTGLYTPNAIHKRAADEWGLRLRLTRIGKGGPVSRITVYNMLTNPFYYGAIESAGERLQGAHDPMVTKEEFDKVQSILSSRSRQRPKRLTFTYSGLMKCGECGASITAENKFKLLKGTGERKKYVYYHCTKRRPGMKCAQRVIEETELEQQIVAFLAKLSISEPFLEWTLKVLETFGEDDRQRELKIAASLEQRITNCEREISELLNVKLKGLIQDNEYLHKKNELVNESLGLKQQLERLRTQNGSAINRCREVFKYAESARGRFEKGSPETKRKILGVVGSNWILKDKKLLIIAQKPFNVIQSFLGTSDGNKAMFEPMNLSLHKHKNPPVTAGLCANLRFLNDVRTAVRETMVKPAQ